MSSGTRDWSEYFVIRSSIDLGSRIKVGRVTLFRSAPGRNCDMICESTTKLAALQYSHHRVWQMQLPAAWLFTDHFPDLVPPLAFCQIRLFMNDVGHFSNRFHLHHQRLPHSLRLLISLFGMKSATGINLSQQPRLRLTAQGHAPVIVAMLVKA